MYLIYKKSEDGTFAEKLGSYEGEKDDTSANRSQLEAEPKASHFLLPMGVDEDVAVLVLVDGAYEIQADPALVAAKLAYAALAPARSILAAVVASKSFGDSLMNEFTVENVLLGITTDAMTGTVRKNMVEVISALQTGSLRDAIIEARAVPLASKDVKYITDARLLSFVNKIETHLGIALSATL